MIVCACDVTSFISLCHVERANKEMFGLCLNMTRKSNMPSKEPKQKGKGNEAKSRETKGNKGTKNAETKQEK